MAFIEMEEFLSWICDEILFSYNIADAFQVIYN